MLDSLSPQWMAVARVFLAVGLAVVCLSLLWEGIRRLRREHQIARELDVLNRRSIVDASKRDKDPLFRSPGDAEAGYLVRLTRYLPHREDLRHLLDRADTDWGIGTFLLLTIGLGAGAGLAASLVVAPIGALAAAIVTATLPYLHLQRRLGRRAAAFEEHFPESIELLARSLRAGHALLTGLEVVADEAPDPVNREFRQVYEQQRFGLPLQESLLGLADRVDSVDVRMFVSSVMIQRESGGNLAEILDNLAELIRERFKFRRQLRVYTAQGRMTGSLLGVLPLIVGAILFAVSRDYMIVLFTEPLGRLALLGTVMMQILGYLWIRRIVNVEF